MAATYKGLGVARYGGEFSIVAVGTVPLTITGIASQTAAYLQISGSDGTHQFSVSKNGGLILRRYTTRPTTGLSKNELILLVHTSTPKLGICTSVAAQTIKLIRLKTKTFGRLTA